MREVCNGAAHDKAEKYAHKDVAKEVGPHHDAGKAHEGCPDVNADGERFYGRAVEAQAEGGCGGKAEYICGMA